MSLRIEAVQTVQNLDPDGHPALGITITLAEGATGSAWISVGPDWDAGPAELLADAAAELSDVTVPDLAGLDELLRKIVDRAQGCDGAEGVHDARAAAGSRAMAGASIAAARALAARDGMPVWRFLAPCGSDGRLPVPHFTVVNGGGRAATALNFEEFTVIPLGAPSVRAAVRAGAEIRERLGVVLLALGLGTQVGADGGFAPEVEWPERVLELIAEAISDAGYTLGEDGVAVGLRVGACQFREGCESYRVAGEQLSSEELVARYEQMVDDFPVWSIEDAMAADDWDGWAELTRRLGQRVQLVGGDVFAADTGRLVEGVAAQVGNAALIKIAQIGTVTETLEVLRVCREAGYAPVISHRDESNDAFIADLAVSAGGGHLRAGAPTCGERVAKYNRLIEIEADSGLPYGMKARGDGRMNGRAADGATLLARGAAGSGTEERNGAFRQQRPRRDSFGTPVFAAAGSAAGAW